RTFVNCRSDEILLECGSSASSAAAFQCRPRLFVVSLKRSRPLRTTTLVESFKRSVLASRYQGTNILPQHHMKGPATPLSSLKERSLAQFLEGLAELLLRVHH